MLGIALFSQISVQARVFVLNKLIFIAMKNTDTFGHYYKSFFFVIDKKMK
jgi:hypothetical protein